MANSKQFGIRNAECGSETFRLRTIPHSRFRIPNSRAGFSLIELLVVIAIISFLTAATAVVAIRFISTARAKATQTTVKKVSELLEARMNAFENFIKTEEKLSARTGRLPVFVRGFVPPPASQASRASRQRAFVLGRKAFFRQQFPQMFDDTGEDRNGNGSLDLGEDLNSNGILDPPADVFAGKTRGDSTESAECLYYLLSQSSAFGAETDDLSHFTSSEVADTDKDGLLEFVDAWGHPLRFYRWPTRLIRPGPASLPMRPIPVDPNQAARFLITRLPDITSLQQDSDDPLGAINPVKPPATDSDLAAFENQYHTANTWHVPLIVSAGPDGELGLFEPNDAANFGTLAQPDSANREALFDDITNLNQQAGGN